MYEVLTGNYGLAGAGVAVSEQSAMCVSAVYASIGLLGGAVATLPFNQFERTDGGLDRYDSDLWWLFNEQPWENWTAASAWSYAVQSIGIKGDGYWRIRRVTPYTNAIQGFEPYHPDRVRAQRYQGRNVYTMFNEDGTVDTIDQDDILHFPGLGFDGLRSITPIRAALRNSVGIALAADEFAGAFFRNGARPDFALTTDETLDDEVIDTLRRTWAEKHSGVGNSHLPAILEGGLKVQELTLSAEDAQLLMTRKFQIEDIARIYGVPPHMIGYTEKSTSWGAGIEQMSIGFLRYTLARYLDPMQQEINRKVWPRSRKIFGAFKRDALLQGDAKAQSEYHSKALGGPGAQGWMTIDEVRAEKGLKPVPGGNRLIFAGSLPAPTTDKSKPDDGSNTDENNLENGDALDAQSAGE